MEAIRFIIQSMKKRHNLFLVFICVTIRFAVEFYLIPLESYGVVIF